MRTLLLALALLQMACALPRAGDIPPRSPLIIAHRGACAERPEHTLAAYQRAIELGADFIEIDLVATRDGHLISRHENELSRTTDISSRKEFANLRTTKRVQGSEVTGWFSEDLTLAEIKNLRAIERMPEDRPTSAHHDGLHSIATLPEIIDLLRHAETRQSRRVGLDIEIKGDTWFAREGTHIDGTPINISIPRRIIDLLVAHRFTDPERIVIQAFEVEPLIELQYEILPAAGIDLPLFQLLGNLGDPTKPFQAPYDFRYNAREGRDPYRGLTACLGVPVAHTGYAELVAPVALRCMKERYAEGISARKENVLLREDAGVPLDLDGDGVPAVRTQLNGRVAEWIADARAAGLLVHFWTLRAEERFRTLRSDGQLLSFDAEARALLALGADGLITDHPKRGAEARDAYLQGLE